MKAVNQSLDKEGELGWVDLNKVFSNFNNLCDFVNLSVILYQIGNQVREVR